MDLWSPQEQQQQQHEFPVNRLYECKPVKRTKKYVLTPAQKKQGSLNSKQYFIFLGSHGRAHFHTFKKY